MKQKLKWTDEADSFVERASSILSRRLDQLADELQRLSGRSRRECWNYLSQKIFRRSSSISSWREEDMERARELLAELPIHEVAKRLGRTVPAVRNMLWRFNLSVRDMQCDLHTVTSLAKVLHVRKEEVQTWIRNGWLVQHSTQIGKRIVRYITSDAFVQFWKTHQRDILARRRFNYSYFEAFYLYCYSPKHTVGDQLLEVRSDKKERLAYANIEHKETTQPSGKQDDDFDNKIDD